MRWTTPGLAGCCLGFWVAVTTASLSAGIPTRAERVLNSGLNPEVQVWLAPEIAPETPADGKPSKNVCYRCEFEAPENVRSAAISMTDCSRATVSVNGKKIAGPLPGRGVPILTYDLAGHLKPGRNVLGVRKEVFGTGMQQAFSLVAEGVVFGADGSVTRLLTGSDWKAGVDLDDGWERPDSGALGMAAAKVLRSGKPANLDFTPPYHGMIEVRSVGMREPIFDEEKRCELAVRIVNGAPAANGDALPVLKAEVFDEVARKLLGEAEVKLTPTDKLDLSGAVTFGPLPRGAYRLRFMLARGGEEIDRRDYEVAVVGRIPQREVEGSSYEDGLDLKEIWSVDCTAEPDEKTFLSCEGGNRLIGYHSERGPATCLMTYYAGPMGSEFFDNRGYKDHPEFYRNWQTTFENLIKKMRFSGQNLYVPGQFMYSSYLYPSKRFQFNQNNYPCGAAGRDYGGLMLRMFEHNGMSMISGIEYAGSPDLLARYPASPEDIKRNGAPTILAISRKGEMIDASEDADSLWSVKSTSDLPALNHLHPEVYGRLLEIVDELIDLYKDFPAWKGIHLYLNREMGGPINSCGWGEWSRFYWKKDGDPLNWGYEDYTVGLFEKETGLKVLQANGTPISPKDPDRFEKRCAWLLANAREKWIGWRCAKFADIHKKIRDRLVAARPDLRLFVSCSEPDMMGGKQMVTTDRLLASLGDPGGMRDVLRSLGFDPELLRNEPNIVIGYAFSGRGQPSDMDGVADPNEGVLRDGAWQRLFADDGRGGAFVHVGLFHVGDLILPQGRWLFEVSKSRQGYPWPLDLREGFVNTLVRSNPTCLPHTLMDGPESMGHLHELRLFSRAYRSLPNGRYERLTGNGGNKGLWIESVRKDQFEYFYAANASGADVKAALLLASGTALHDLIADRPVALAGERLVLDLGPFEVRSFRAERRDGEAGSVVIKIESSIPGPQ